jgi:hypothetical protein
VRIVKQWWYGARYRKALRRFYARVLLEQLPREEWPRWARRTWTLAQCQKIVGQRLLALAAAGYRVPPDCVELNTRLLAAMRQHYNEGLYHPKP